MFLPVWAHNQKSVETTGWDYTDGSKDLDGTLSCTSLNTQNQHYVIYWYGD